MDNRTPFTYNDALCRDEVLNAIRSAGFTAQQFDVMTRCSGPCDLVEPTQELIKLFEIITGLEYRG